MMKSRKFELIARIRRALALHGVKASDQTEWMNDCVPYMMDGGREQDEAIAACIHMWEEGGDYGGRALKYSEDEPRDESGRWTDGGGGGDSGGSEKPSGGEAKPKLEHIIASVPGAKEAIDKARAKLATGVPTKPANGQYSPQRQALHDTILKSMFTRDRVAAATPAKGEAPTVHLLGGSGGSGKSWFMRNGNAPADKAIYINSDDVKEALPEYQGWNAALLHEESSDVGRKAEDYARSHGLNVILDGTMGKKEALDKRIADYKNAGYKVVGHFMRVKPETSAKRALERFVRGGETGRFVSPEMIMSHNAVGNFEKAREKMDDWEMYDNEGDAPKLVTRR